MRPANRAGIRCRRDTTCHLDGNRSTNTTDATGFSLANTKLVLHPGDDVSFECSAWDPGERPVTWEMVVRPGGPTVTQEGLKTRFHWLVAEDNISGSVYVEITMTGAGPWHRMGSGNDGQVTFMYAVLPR
jgi:hypothetical protein